APSISGTPGQPGPVVPQAGQTLTAQNGVWDFNPASYSYQWSRCNIAGTSCSTIAGATSSTYVPVSADANAALRVSVTATNSAGSTSAQSPPTFGVQVPPPPNTFGKTTIGAQADPSGADVERVEVFTIAQAVAVQKLTIYLRRWSSGQQVLQGVLYADQGGA